jgi:SAM-dependent methyltransferase
MCSDKVLEFGERALVRDIVVGKRVLEVGARIVQDRAMSLRHHAQALSPAAYVGVDMMPGFGVDELCSATALVDRYGCDAFDVVLSTELMEHVEDWQAMVRNFKQVVKPGGLLLLTTRSEGFPYHGWPCDYWRFSFEDMAALFADFDILALEKDPKEPGVFLFARKPLDYTERTPDLVLYSIIARRRTPRVGRLRRLFFLGVLGARHTYIRIVPERARMALNRLLGRRSRSGSAVTLPTP